jgi:hypothetical protein
MRANGRILIIAILKPASATKWRIGNRQQDGKKQDLAKPDQY